MKELKKYFDVNVSNSNAYKIAGGYYILHERYKEHKNVMKYDKKTKILTFLTSAPESISIYNNNHIVDKFIDEVISLLQNELEPYMDCILIEEKFRLNLITENEYEKWFDENFYGNSKNNAWNKENNKKWLKNKVNLIDDVTKSLINFYFKDDTAYISINDECINVIEYNMSDDYGELGIFGMYYLLKCFKDLKEYIKEEEN